MAKKKKVIIVGGGISAMLAVATCNEEGITPTVMVLCESPPTGAFWLRNVPIKFRRNKLKPEKISVKAIGIRQNYMFKQWGKGYEEKSCSFPKQNHQTTGYDPRWLSLSASKKILDFHRDSLDRALTDQDMLLLAKPETIVFYTFPSDKSYFRYNVDDSLISTLRIATLDYGDSKNTVTYDGIKDSIFSRCSKLFGTCSFELRKFPEVMSRYGKVKIYGEWISYRKIQEIRPNVGNLDPFTPGDRVYPIGRLACWKRSMLADEVQQSVRKVLHG